MSITTTTSRSDDYTTFGCGTVLPIKIDDYSTLHILYNNGTEVTMDISTIVGDYYVGVSESFHFSGFRQSNIIISQSQSGYLESTAKYTALSYVDPMIIQRVWLEK